MDNALVVLFAAILLTAQPIHPEWRVAYTARFYYPPGDRRISHSQLFVCDLHGGHRRQLTRGTDEATDAWWMGANAITWIDRADGRNTLMKIDLATGKRTVLAKGRDVARNDLDEIGGPLSVRGRPVYVFAGAYRAVTASGLVEIPHRDRDGGGGLGAGALELGQNLSREVTIKLSDGTTWDVCPAKIARNGKAYELAVPGALRHVLESSDTGYGWIFSNTIAASAGSADYLQRVDWQTGALTMVLDDLFGLDFDGAHRYWGAVDGGRPLSPYGKNKRVWTSAAWVGDVQSGKRWRIAQGLVYASSVSLRPE